MLRLTRLQRKQTNTMRIVMGLYYYFPYVSGLSVYTKHLAEALVEHNYEVTVITSCYDRSLDKEQTMNGVRVIRVPVLLRFNKGVIMPTFVPMLYQHGKKADILLLHLPLAEASVITRLLPGKVLINYICDIRLNGRGIAKTLLEYIAYQ